MPDAATRCAPLGYVIAVALSRLGKSSCSLNDRASVWRPAHGHNRVARHLCWQHCACSLPGRLMTGGQKRQRVSRRFVRALIAGLLILSMLGAHLKFTADQQRARSPRLGARRRTDGSCRARTSLHHSGSLILTSVVAQAPIIAGEWAAGRFSPVRQIVRLQYLSLKYHLQEQARQGFRQLDESVTTAIVVGLRRAGYSADLIGKGVDVLSIQPDSHAQGVLQAAM